MPDNRETGCAQQVGSEVIGGDVISGDVISGQQRVCLPQRNQPPVPFQQLAVHTLSAKAPLEDAIQEGGFLLWIGRFRGPAKSFELFFSFLEQCLGRLWLTIVRKEIERRSFSILLAHEQHGQIGGQQYSGGSQFQSFKINKHG